MKTSRVTNSVAPQKAEEFKYFIKNVLSSDPEKLYIEGIEANAEDEDG